MSNADGPDTYFISYGVFYLLGILANVPPQFFIIASDYWMWKFRDPQFDNSICCAGPWLRTPLQKYFISSVNVLFQICLPIFLFITARFSRWLPPAENRVQGSLACLIVLFTTNALMAPLNTDTYKEGFFAISLLLGLALNVCTSIALVSLCELVSKFPLSHYAALQSGPAICGTLASLIRVCTLLVSTTHWVSGLVFFTTGAILASITLLVYAVARQRSDYFIYRVTAENPMESTFSDRKKVRDVLRKVKIQVGALVLSAGGTALIFPGVVSLVVSMKVEHKCGNDWGDVYFTPVASYLMFHIGDLVGRELATRIQKPKSPRIMLILACLRLPLLPLFLFCNAQPRHNFPVVFNDGVYVLLIILVAFSNGYVANICLLAAPKEVEETERTLVTVVTLLVASLAQSIASGLSMLLVVLL